VFEELIGHLESAISRGVVDEREFIKQNACIIEYLTQTEDFKDCGLNEILAMIKKRADKTNTKYLNKMNKLATNLISHNTKRKIA